jgi:hypothetical protein
LRITLKGKRKECQLGSLQAAKPKTTIRFSVEIFGGQLTAGKTPPEHQNTGQDYCPLTFLLVAHGKGH